MPKAPTPAPAADDCQQHPPRLGVRLTITHGSFLHLMQVPTVRHSVRLRAMGGGNTAAQLEDEVTGMQITLASDGTYTVTIPT